MALGTNQVTTSVANNFIPELWSDEVIGAYKSNLVVANLVTKLSHKGKKGDTIYIPIPARGSASAKAANTEVTLSAATNTKLTISIDKHYEYSKLIEDIAEVQALSSMRKFYVDDAGYALAKQVDTDLFSLAEGFQGGTVGGSAAASYENAVIGSNGSTAYTGDSSNAADITDAGIRRMLLTLDDADVYISSNCPSAAGNSGADRVGMLMHKDALVLAEQLGVRTQSSYIQQYLGDLFTADTIYGVAEMRNDAGVAFVVPGS